ncbi:MAG: Uma2 family endonuclease [Gemmataceae bacterium]|nr:Uma2 family endonuclease [Gemmataceae bacterium]
MDVLVKDPELADELIARREASDGDKWNEVWDGVLVMPTLPNDEHQELQCNLMAPLLAAVGVPGLGKVRAGVNVTDRHPDWRENYRCPDVVVYLNNSPAVNHSTYWVGGPDFLAEIISPGEDPTGKHAFYAAVGTREVLVIDRDPWALELFRLAGGRLVSAGRSDASNPAVLASGVLPLTFALRAAQPRPLIDITHAATGQTWVA